MSKLHLSKLWRKDALGGLGFRTPGSGVNSSSEGDSCHLRAGGQVYWGAEELFSNSNKVPTHKELGLQGVAGLRGLALPAGERRGLVIPLTPRGAGGVFRSG